MGGSGFWRKLEMGSSGSWEVDRIRCLAGRLCLCRSSAIGSTKGLFDDTTVTPPTFLLVPMIIDDKTKDSSMKGKPVKDIFPTGSMGVGGGARLPAPHLSNKQAFPIFLMFMFSVQALLCSPADSPRGLKEHHLHVNLLFSAVFS